MRTRSASTQNYSIHLEICTDEEEGALWVEVWEYEYKKRASTEVFNGDEYKKALEYFDKQLAKLEEAYKNIQHVLK